MVCVCVCPCVCMWMFLSFNAVVCFVRDVLCDVVGFVVLCVVSAVGAFWC